MNMMHCLLLATGLSAAACATSDRPPLADGAPSAGSLPQALAPWGGIDASRWTPEAILANAVTAELQRDPTARVSVPAVLWTSQYAPFSDGQTNAAASLEYWKGPRPPVIGTRSGSRVTIRFDRTLPFGGDTFELWTSTGTWMRSVPSTRTPEGDWRIELVDLPAPLAQRMVVSPRGWRDGFPLDFELPISSATQLAGTLPSYLQHLPGGEPVLDPVGAAGGTPTAYDVLRSTNFPAGFNQLPYPSDTVHAAFPQNSGPRVTAVGGSSTWLTETPLKNIYICFAPRAPLEEAKYGVPSGAGWHRIGDAGESLVSSLEDSPLLVGYAASAVMAPPSGGQFAYGLYRATTYALLQPGQAFTTPRDGFHWYAIHQASHPCTQIWLHRCEPSASAPSMACPGD